jgi:hypothetical protein
VEEVAIVEMDDIEDWQ